MCLQCAFHRKNACKFTKDEEMTCERHATAPVHNGDKGLRFVALRFCAVNEAR
ncbi:hypothetical protein J6590_047248, partial [Homalodisca vitripennis]